MQRPSPRTSPAAIVNCICLSLAALVSCSPLVRGGRPDQPKARVRHASDQDSATLSVLSYNVKGLPGPLAGWHTSERLLRILARTSMYDLVLLQELWRLPSGYRVPEDRTLLSQLPGPGHSRIRQTGLAAIGRKSTVSVLQHEYIPFHTRCAGWVLGANDCFARKGVLFLRLSVRGETLDVYTTHLDAGHGAADRRARTGQLDEIAGIVIARSQAAPVVLCGDFNVERGIAADFSIMEAFLKRLKLFNTRAQQGTMWKEALDYCLVRGANDVAVEVLAAAEDEDFRDGTAPLSDHPALAITLRLRHASQ